LLDRRQFDEACQAALAGNADGDQVPLEAVPRQELLQGLAGQLVGVGVRLTQNLGMLNVVEGGGRDLAVDIFHAEGLQGTLAEIDPPHTGLNWHKIDPQTTAQSGGQQTITRSRCVFSTVTGCTSETVYSN